MMDVEYSNGQDTYGKYDEMCESDTFYGYKGGFAVGSVSAIFKGSGKANLKYKNCFKSGYVSVSLNGKEIDRNPNKLIYIDDVLSFRYEEADFLEIKEFRTAIIKLHYLHLADGGILSIYF